MKDRTHDFSAQARRLWLFFLDHPDEDWSQPRLNSVAADNEGNYVNSFTKRISECRARARAQGMDLILSLDEWDAGHARHTWYRLVTKPLAAAAGSQPDGEIGAGKSAPEISTAESHEAAAPSRTTAAAAFEIMAGVCTECGGPVFHRDGHPGEYDHECGPSPNDQAEPLPAENRKP